jgi:hypothetical protein
MEVSFRLANAVVSLSVSRLSRARPQDSDEDVIKRALREENIRKALAERERLTVKVISNRGIF